VGICSATLEVVAGRNLALAIAGGASAMSNGPPEKRQEIWHKLDIAPAALTVRWWSWHWLTLTKSERHWD
jgi:hypothetical protein